MRPRNVAIGLFAGMALLVTLLVTAQALALPIDPQAGEDVVESPVGLEDEGSSERSDALDSAPTEGVPARSGDGTEDDADPPTGQADGTPVEAERAGAERAEDAGETAADAQEGAAAATAAPAGALAAAATHAYLQTCVEYSRHAWDGVWVTGGGQDAGTTDPSFYQMVGIRLQNAGGVTGNVNYQATLQVRGKTAVARNGAKCGTSGLRCPIEDLRVWLDGDIARCYSVSYTLLMSGGHEYRESSGGGFGPALLPYRGWSGWLGKTLSGSDGAWTHADSHPAFSYPFTDGGESRSVAANQFDGGNVPVRKVTVSLTPRSYTHRVRVRRENADGTWGDWEEARSTTNAYLATVPAYDVAQTATHRAASMAAYAAGYADRTNSVDVHRKTAAVAFRYRLQNADGSWPEDYRDGAEKTARVGEIVSWTTEADGALWQNQTASGTVLPATSNDAEPDSVDVYVDVPRRSWPVRVRTIAPGGLEDPHAAAFVVSLDGGVTWTEGVGSLDREASPGATVTIRDLRPASGLRVRTVDCATDAFSTVEPNEGTEQAVPVAEESGTWSLDMPAGGIVISIRMAPARYTVSFVAEEAGEGVPADIVAEWGTRGTIPMSLPQREGWEFACWQAPDGATYLPGNDFQNLADEDGATVTLLASWTAVIRVRVPVAIHYVADSEGNLVGPSDGVTAIANEGSTDVAVCRMQAEGTGGIDLVSRAPRDGEAELLIRPGRNGPLSLGALPDEGADTDAEGGWVIEPGASLPLDGLVGRIGAVDLATERQIGTIHWTFRATG